MRRTSLVLLLLGCAIIPCLAQAPETRPVPRIVCAHPDFDLGDLCCGDSFEWAWQIENAGTAALEISSVLDLKAGRAEAEKKTLQPGDTTFVTLHSYVPAAEWAGPFARGVRVMSNDPVSPRFDLRVTGRAVRPLEPSVRQVEFGSLPKASAGAARIRMLDFVSFRGDGITDARTDPPFEVVGWERIAAPNQRDRHRITVRLADPAPVGDVSTDIRIVTTALKQRTITVPVSARVEPEVRVSPRTFNFGAVRRGDPRATKTIEIDKTGEAPLAIESVRVDPLGGFTTRVEEVQPGRRYRLIVAVSPEVADRYVRGIVTIRTNCPGETEVPLYCFALVNR
jgi:hypothetical protein